MQNKKLSLGKHETFPLRRGWMEKGLDSLVNHGSATFSKEDGAVLLGVGNNMMHAIRFWMRSSGIITHPKPVLTEFGELLCQYDPYFEKKTTWLLIHYNLCSDFESNPVFYYLMNINEKRFVNSDECYKEISEYFTLHGYQFNERSLKKDIDMFFMNYGRSGVEDNPEENFVSPLASLGLLTQLFDQRGMYKINSIINNVDFDLVVLYILSNLYQDNSFNISDSFQQEKSPAKVFCMNQREYDHVLNSLKNKGMISLIKTAGLNSAQILREVKLADLYSD